MTARYLDLPAVRDRAEARDNAIVDAVFDCGDTEPTISGGY